MNTALLLFLRSNRRYLLAMLGASALVNGAALALPLFSSLVYDKAMGNQVHDTLWALFIGMGLMLVLEATLRLVRVQIIEHAGAHWDAFLDSRLLRGVLSAPLDRTLPVANVLNGVREVSATREVLSAQSLLSLVDVPFLLLFTAVVAMIAGPIVLIPLGVGVLVFIVTGVSQRLSAHRQRAANVQTSHRLSLMVDVLSARDGLLGQASVSTMQQRFREHSREAGRASSQARWWAQVGQQLVPVLMSASTVGVLVAGVFRVEEQLMSVGALISVNLIGSRILNILCGLAPLPIRWREFAHALGTLGDIVPLQLATPAPALACDSSATPGAIAAEGLVLDEVDFIYPGRDRPFLEGVNVRLKVGEMVAVIGSSGAGKSTLLRLLAGQVGASRGRHVVGAHAVSDDASRLWLQRQVALKAQSPSFLAGTVCQVVTGGEAVFDETRVVLAMRRAGLGAALDRGDIGLNLAVGANGRGLSGGQCQMLALAAVFYSERPIVLLDEPTLGLDRAAQEAVLGSLRELSTDRILVVATHASEVIALADRVLVIDRGRVVADAPPARLIPGLASRQTGSLAPRPVSAPPAPAASSELRHLDPVAG